MTTGRFLAGVATAMLVWVGLPEQARAQELTRTEQACVNTLNKDFAKLSSAHGKQIWDCVKLAAMGKLAGSLTECASRDRKGKIAKARSRTEKDALRCCGSPPPFGVTDADTVNDAAVNQELALIEDLFG